MNASKLNQRTDFKFKFIISRVASIDFIFLQLSKYSRMQKGICFDQAARFLPFVTQVSFGL